MGSTQGVSTCVSITSYPRNKSPLLLTIGRTWHAELLSLWERMSLGSIHDWTNTSGGQQNTRGKDRLEESTTHVTLLRTSK
eukprot:8963087-Pyramimonas_sp.AAC.1